MKNLRRYLRLKFVASSIYLIFGVHFFNLFETSQGDLEFVYKETVTSFAHYIGGATWLAASIRFYSTYSNTTVTTVIKVTQIAHKPLNIITICFRQRTLTHCMADLLFDWLWFWVSIHKTFLTVFLRNFLRTKFKKILRN